MDLIMSTADSGMVTLPEVKKEDEKVLSPSSPSTVYLMPSVILESSDDCNNSNAFGDITDYSPGSPTTPDHFNNSHSLHSENFEFCSQKETDEMPRRSCLVCGDVASGFHYGVASCEACKAFFKRTIQGNIEYTCLAANDCEINKRRRKACQACRFQKCLQKGMLKEGVRLDRVRGGRQKYRRNTQGPCNVSSPMKNNYLPEDNKILEILLNCEPELPNASVPDGEPPFSTHLILNLLSSLYDKELVNVISWAKQIPGFSELSLSNQMKLLQSTWTEILTFALAYRSLNSYASSKKLMFAVDFYLDEVQAQECGALELFQLCVIIIERLRCSVISKEEFFLLKALVLANSDVLLEEAIQLKRFRESILSALIDCATTIRGNSSDASHLILCLPVIRQADGIVRRFWENAHNRGTVVMNKLFKEMLGFSQE